MNKNTNDLIKRAYEMACEHGFHDKELSVEHCLMLVITEVSEMVEADRKGKYASKSLYVREINTRQPENLKAAHKRFCFDTFIKDSFEDEMADACIRLYDAAGAFGIRFRKSQLNVEMDDIYYDYVAPKTLPEKAFLLCGVIMRAGDGGERLDGIIGSALNLLELMAEEMGVDLFWYIEKKMEYNETRKRLHGKKY